jgi:hypothetical protein
MLNRRALLRQGLTATVVPCAAAASSVRCIDFNRAFVDHTGGQNEIRFKIESITTVVERDGSSQTFYVCASLKSEALYVEGNLFTEDNYDFRAVLTTDRDLLFRRWADANHKTRSRGAYREVRPIASGWGRRAVRLNDTSASQLRDYAAVEAARHSGGVIVARTEMRDTDTGRSAVIEYPVNTISMSPARRLWQIDTGPVALPDLPNEAVAPIDGLRLAYAAFNAATLNSTSFVIEMPTRIARGGVNFHYADRITVPAMNTLWLAQRIPA